MNRIVKFIVAGCAIIALVGLVVAAWAVEAPPHKIRLATGRPGSAYQAATADVKRILERSGIKVELVTTQGTADKLARLTAKDDKIIDAAIIRSGKPGAAELKGVVNLGAMFLEPIWVFGRDLPPGTDVRRLIGKRVALSASSAEPNGLATTLLADNGLSAKDVTLVRMKSAEAADALLAGQVDAAWIVGGVKSAWVQKLLSTPGIELVSFERAEAYAGRHGFLLSTQLPEGAIDLGRDIPAQTIKLIGPSAQLIVRADLNPAVQSLLLDAMQEAFSGGDMVSKPGLFPNKNLIDIPLSEEARRYYTSGPTFFRRLLPFWLANFAERFVFFVLPILTLIYPVVRSVPPIYNWRIREKISDNYRQLRQLETKARSATNAEERDEICGKLRGMMHRLGHIRIPLNFADDFYRLRSHIRFVLDSIEHGGVVGTLDGPKPVVPA